MAAREEVSEWQKLPAPLQHQFYDHAVREADKCVEFLRKLRQKLEGLREDLSFLEVEEGDWSDLRVAVVDGSCPPAPDVRLRGSYALFCSSYKLFEGAELVDEGYKSGMLFVENTMPGTSSRTILRLLMTRLERKSALDALRKGADWVILDGSFFGFRYRCKRVKDEEVTWYEARGDSGGREVRAKGGEIIEEVFRDTKKILETNSVAVVKRARSAALDGYLIEKHWGKIKRSKGGELGDVVTTLIDKAVLSILMPTGRYFVYDALFDHAGDFYSYSVLAGVCREWIEKQLRDKKPLDFDELLTFSVKWVEHRERRENMPNRVFKEYYSVMMEDVRRGYFKAFDEAPACCFEIHKDRPLDKILPYLASFNNPDTGHPFPLDLVDEDVRLPVKFVREFVQEVEAQILRRADADLVRNLFQYLNPQKKWGY